MARSNQPPKPECCRVEGQAQVSAQEAESRTTIWRRTQGDSQAASESRTSLKQFSLETILQRAGGDAVASAEPNTETNATGEFVGDLPGSQSVAREARAARKLGRPAVAPDANCGSQAGRSVQRQEEPARSVQGIRPARSSLGSGKRCPNPEQGAGRTTQPAKETSAVRTTESSWRTSLRAITNKAAQEPKHRFGGLYRLLNQDSLRECFYALRKDAAPGVDGMTFKEYEKNLESNLADLVRRLKNKSYRARLVRRKYIPKGNGKLRPLGIPTLEEKLVQSAAAQILSSIYEADFLECSYGYRPGRNPLQAVRALSAALHRGQFEFVVEADIKGYFQHIRHDWLLKMLALRVNDGALLGLIRNGCEQAFWKKTDASSTHRAARPKGGVFLRCWPTCICITCWTYGLSGGCVKGIAGRAGCSALRTTLCAASITGTRPRRSRRGWLNGCRNSDWNWRRTKRNEFVLGRGADGTKVGLNSWDLSFPGGEATVGSPPLNAAPVDRNCEERFKGSPNGSRPNGAVRLPS